MSVLRNFLAVTGALLFLWWGWGVAWTWFASDSEQIEALLDDMVEGFNATRMRSVMKGFAEDYRDESSGAERTEVQQVLVHLFFREIDRESKGFRLRAELGPDDVELQFLEGADPPRAEAQLKPHFEEFVGGTWVPWWEAELRAEFEQRDGRWRIVRTSRVNHASRRDLR